MAADQNASAHERETAVDEKPENGKAAKLVDRVLEQLRQRIKSGNYPANSRLPGEHELASLLGVSRPVLRDALGKLREEGMVYSRQGAGTFVRASLGEPSLAYSPVSTLADVQRCYEFRLTIEPAAAYFAALRRDDAAIQKIAQALAQLRDATRLQLHKADADFLFHRAVTEAANNHYYTASMDALHQHIAVCMQLHGMTLMGPRPHLEAVFDEHAGIYQAIADGRAADARDGMRAHLEGSRDRLFEGKVLDLSFKSD